MQLTSEMTIGLIALFGISVLTILMILKRYGVIKFVNGDRCPDHESFCNAFKALKEEHIVQGEILKQHGKQLDEGKEIFNQIRNDIAQININVALIMQELKIQK